MLKWKLDHAKWAWNEFSLIILSTLKVELTVSKTCGGYKTCVSWCPSQVAGLMSVNVGIAPFWARLLVIKPDLNLTIWHKIGPAVDYGAGPVARRSLLLTLPLIFPVLTHLRSVCHTSQSCPNEKTLVQVLSSNLTFVGLGLGLGNSNLGSSIKQL